MVVMLENEELSAIMTTVYHLSKKTHPILTVVLKSANIVRHRIQEKITFPVIQYYLKSNSKAGRKNYIYRVFQTLPQGYCDSYQNMILKSHDPDICWKAKYLLYSGKQFTKVKPLKKLQMDLFTQNVIVYQYNHEGADHLLAISSNFEFGSTEIFMDEESRTKHLDGYMQDVHSWYMPLRTQWIIQPAGDYIFELHDIGLYNVHMITLDSKSSSSVILHINGAAVDDRIMVDNPKSITVNTSSIAIITVHRKLR